MAIPERPYTRVEMYLDAIANNGGGGGGGSGAGGVFVVTMTYDEQTAISTLSASYNQIVEAVKSGKLPVLVEEFDDRESGGSYELIIYTLIYTTEQNGIYKVSFKSSSSGRIFSATDPDELLNDEPITNG